MQTAYTAHAADKTFKLRENPFSGKLHLLYDIWRRKYEKLPDTYKWIINAILYNFDFLGKIFKPA